MHPQTLSLAATLCLRKQFPRSHYSRDAFGGDAKAMSSFEKRWLNHRARHDFLKAE
jgi:hypothetical protein